MARRSGNRWFIAVMNGADATSLDLPLDFLGKGEWNAAELFEAKDKPDAWDRQSAKLTKTDHLKMQLSPRGGFVAYIVK